jgi:GGDEF domain-containing protein
VASEHPGTELSLLEVTTSAQRAVLRARRPEDVVRALERAVRALGGSLVPAHVGGEDVLQLDVTLGVTDARLPMAPVGDPARSHLQQVLPGLVEDARRMVHLLWARDELGDPTLRDDLTGALHAGATRRLVERGRPPDTLVGVAVADLEAVLDTYGRARVDALLHQLAGFVRSELDVDERLGRLDHRTLVVVLRGDERPRAAELVDRVGDRWARQRLLPVALGTVVVHRGEDPTAALRALVEGAASSDADRATPTQPDDDPTSDRPDDDRTSGRPDDEHRTDDRNHL